MVFHWRYVVCMTHCATASRSTGELGCVQCVHHHLSPGRRKSGVGAGPRSCGGHPTRPRPAYTHTRTHTHTHTHESMLREGVLQSAGIAGRGAEREGVQMSASMFLMISYMRGVFARGAPAPCFVRRWAAVREAPEPAHTTQHTDINYPGPAHT